MPSEPLPPSFKDLLSVSWKIGWRSLGGPAAQIQLLHEEFVGKRGWISEPTFQSALGLCTLIPGPEAQQLAIFLGYILHGPSGALCSGFLFLAPGALCIAVWSTCYVLFPGHPTCDWILELLRSAGLGLLLAAVLLMARRSLKSATAVAIALATYILCCFRLLPFPLLVLGAGLLGACFPRSEPLSKAARSTNEPPTPKPSGGDRNTPDPRSALRQASFAAALWLLPLAALVLLLGQNHRLSEIAALLTKTALTTFGGAYSILPYVARESVETLRWFSPTQMLDGIALGESTPGPLLLVLQFYGFLAARNAPHPFAPAVAGLLGSLIALWSTFAPAFVWVLATAPFASRILQQPRIQNALLWIGFCLAGSLAHLGAHIAQLEWERHAQNPWLFLAITASVLLWRLRSLRKPFRP
jgi:chromate transporter